MATPSSQAAGGGVSRSGISVTSGTPFVHPAQRELVRIDQFEALVDVPRPGTGADVDTVLHDAAEALDRDAAADESTLQVGRRDDHGADAGSLQLVRSQAHVVEHRVSHPPSTGSWMPSIQDASSLSSQETAEAMSAGTPTRGTRRRCFMTPEPQGS